MIYFHFQMNSKRLQNSQFFLFLQKTRQNPNFTNTNCFICSSKEKCFDSFTINFADTIKIDELKSKLYNWGYYFVDIVTSEGEVSIRGDIIDICPLGSEFGYRVSLFDDEVESIRKFDIEDQKSTKDEIETFTINPAFLALDENSLGEINEKIENISSDAFIKDIHSLGFWYLDELGNIYLKNLVHLSLKKRQMSLMKFMFLKKKSK